MRQGWVLAAVGGLVFVGVGIATLPASLLVSRLPPQVALEGVGGSIWNGGATRVSYQGVPVGALAWRSHPVALFTGRLAYDVDVRRTDGYVRGTIAITFGGAVTAENVQLALPITALHPNAGANAWRGDLQGTVQWARLEDGWPVDLVAELGMLRLQPPRAALNVGDYAVTFDEGASTPDRLVGRVRDTNAPLVVRAQLVVKRDRSYTLEGEVAPKPGAPRAITDSVAFLGPADAMGRRAFQITGTF
jgi:general secretion pathway protein N